jgi:outer membrane protein OmpA-like peptidoglycan-associated protein
LYSNLNEKEMSIKTSILISIFTLIVSKSLAQDYDKIFKLAEESLYLEDFETALVNYQLLVESGLNYGNRVFYKAELCSLLTKYQNKPINNFLQYEEEMIQEDKFYYYWKGRVMMKKYRMQEANIAFRKFLNIKAYLSNEIKQEARKWMKWVANAKSLMDNPESYEIHLLDEGVNTEYAELSPVYFMRNEELLFMSNREGDPDVYQIYHTVHEGNREWSEPSPIYGQGLFTRETANIEVVDDDGRLFQFRPYKGGDLFYSEPTGDLKGWSAPQEFDSRITSAHLSSHFFINEHEDRIIFSSEVGSKKNSNLDLMQSFKDASSGNWSKPAPFANSINSDFNEDSPYLSPDEQTIYFASDGHRSMGGYDIFKSTFDPTSQTWSEPKNLGFPLNSPEDELHFKMNTNQKSGYFTSNRLNTFGDYDIFFFWEIQKINIQGRVVDNETGLPLKDAEIFFRPYEYLDMYFYSEITDDGKYRARITSDEVFRVEIKRNGVVLHSEDFEIHATDADETTHIKDFYLGEGEAEKTQNVAQRTINTSEPDLGIVTEEMQLGELGTKFRASNKVAVQHIYFDFGTSHLKDESLPSLVAIKNLLVNNPSLQIEIAGHTDNVGGKDSNDAISLKRAQSVLSWLTQNGISSSRLSAVGYGSKNPLASNDDEKDGRELNRRIEIVVIE